MLDRALKASAILSAVFALELPLAAADGGPVLPPPTGPYPVGRTTLYMLDQARDDARGTQKDHKREFWSQIWYPAASGSQGKPAPWMLPEWLRLGADYHDLLAKSPDPVARDAQTYLASVVVHARENLPLASTPERFPVILLAPGSISFPSKYSSLAEDLASHGFIVVGDAPVGNGITVPFPAGNVTPGYSGDMFALWAGDLIYELDQLKTWNETKGQLFYGRVDLGRIGALGHSAGGLIVARVPRMDKRLKAIALLDPGYVEPEDGEAIPVLVFKSDHKDSPNSREKARRENEYAKKAMPGIQMKVIGAEHASFTDLAVIPGFARPGDGKAFNETIRAVLREFFGQTLRGERSELLVKGSDKYPLLRIEKDPLY
jgi:dienelactone hydrolase